MAKNELIVDINVKMTVTEEQAKRALKIVEWYTNDTGDRICSEREKDGKVRMYFGTQATSADVERLKAERCRYDGSGIWEGRCLGTKEVDPCPGHQKCERFTPADVEERP